MRSPPLRDFDPPAAGEILTGQGLGSRNSLTAERRTPPAALKAGSRPHVDDMIGGANDVLVVLYDQDGVAQVSELQQCFKQARRVARVQADAGFVQDVQHARQLGPDLGGQPDALAFSAGEGLGRPSRVR